MFKFPKRHNKGFTLIELLVVIAIIGILASVVLASLGSTRASARDAQRLSEARQLQNSLELFRNKNNGSYPCSDGTTTATTGCASQTQLTPASDTPQLFAFRTAINWQYRADSGRLRYRLRSNNLSGTNTTQSNNPDRSSYTIIVQAESARVNSAGQAIAANAWCKINQGAGHAAYNTTLNCF